MSSAPVPAAPGPIEHPSRPLPATLIAAALITFAGCALAAFASLSLLALTSQSPKDFGLPGVDEGDLKQRVILQAVWICAWSAAASLIAVLMLCRVARAKGALMMSAAGAAAFSATRINSGVGTLTLLAALATLVLLGVPSLAPVLSARRRLRP